MIHFRQDVLLFHVGSKRDKEKALGLLSRTHAPRPPPPPQACERRPGVSGSISFLRIFLVSAPHHLDVVMARPAGVSANATAIADVAFLFS